MPIPNEFIQRLEVTFETEDHQNTNVFHFGPHTGSGFAGTNNELITAWLTDVWPVWRAAISNQTYLTGLKAQMAHSEFDHPVIRTIGRDPGTVSSMDPLPSNVALHYFLRQQEIDQRSFRNVYIAGASESWIVAGLWDYAGHTAAIDALGARLRNILVSPNANNWLPVLKHKTSTPPAPSTYAYYAVTLWRFTRRPARMRRRSVFSTRGFPLGGGSPIPAPDIPDDFTPSFPIGDEPAEPEAPENGNGD